MNNNITLTLSAIIAIIIIIVIAIAIYEEEKPKDSFAPARASSAQQGWDPNDPRLESDGPARCDDDDGFNLAYGYPYNFAEVNPDPSGVGVNRMYSTAEIDPMITGQLDQGARAGNFGVPGRRGIYGGRTSFGNKWGLREFGSGLPGETGVDVGPFGMKEYSLDGLPDTFDDGIPNTWNLPSTPMKWYRPKNEDYYDVESQQPMAFEKHLMSLQEPDHEPPMN